jgi:DNA-binding NarL/FixJ family response regulator
MTYQPTEREQSIILLLAQGQCRKYIARKLGIALNYLKDIVTRLRKKMGAKNATHLVALFVQRGGKLKPLYCVDFVT